MLKKKSIGINALLNVIKTFLSIVFPLITFPYVSRVLQAENLGKVNYVQSIVGYFALFAALGYTTYAIREGSRLKYDKKELNILFSEIFSMNMFTTIISYVLLIASCVIIGRFRSYWILFIIESFSLFFTTIGVEWINVVFEDYVYITIRSFILQIISLICLFVFVKNSEDYYIYAIITVLCSGAISVLNYIHIRKFCTIKLTKKLNFQKHIKPVLVLFSNNIAVSIYLNSDNIMLGWMVGDISVGLYAVSVKIYTIVKRLIAAIYSVAVARMSKYYGEGKTDEFSQLLNKIIGIIITVSIPATIGMILTAKDIIYVLSGNGYAESTRSLQLLSFAFFFAVLGGFFANCINIPLRREKCNLIATSVSSVENILLNIVLIPVYKQNGAAITTFFAELTVFVMLLVGLKDYYSFIEFKKLFSTTIKCGFSSISIVLIWLLLRKYFCLSGMIYLVLMILLSGILYFVLCVILQNYYVLKVLKIICKKIDM